MRNLFREEVYENQKNRLLGEVLVVPNFSYSFITLVLLFWVILLIFWLTNNQYSRKQMVTGWLEPQGGIVKIFPENTVGSVKEVLVENGQFVEKGTSLVVINGEKILETGEVLESSLLNEYNLQKKLLSKRLVRSTSIYEININNISKQLEAAKAELEHLIIQIKGIRLQQAIVEKKILSSKKMNALGHISDIELDIAREKKLSIDNEYQNLIRDKLNHYDRISQLEYQLILLPKEHDERVDDIHSKISELTNQIVQLQANHSYIVRASKSGFITNLQVKQGQHIFDNKPLMSIVPNGDEMVANLLIPVSAAGFIVADQLLEIRYDAFPYQKFGSYLGYITQIPDSLILPNEVHSLPIKIDQPVYMVKASLNDKCIKAYGQEIPLKQGMTFSASINLSERTVIEWLLEPILSIQGQI